MGAFIGTGRVRVDSRLSKLPNVYVTSIGYKTAGKSITGEVCLIVHVTRKLREGTLGTKSATIPKSITLNGQRFVTDVVLSNFR